MDDIFDTDHGTCQECGAQAFGDLEVVCPECGKVSEMRVQAMRETLEELDKLVSQTEELE